MADRLFKTENRRKLNVSSWISSSDSNTDISMNLYCKRKGAAAIGVQTSDGFVVKKGSKILEHTTNGCPDHVINKRQQHKNAIGDDFILTEDILFNTPS